MNQRKIHQAEVTLKGRNTGSANIFKITKVARKGKKDNKDSKDKVKDDNEKLVDKAKSVDKSSLNLVLKFEQDDAFEWPV